MRPFVLLAAVVLMGAGLPAAAAEDCPNPYVTVVKKDGGLVEGILRQDLGDQGVLVDVNGKKVLIPDSEISYVDEDCSRGAGATRAAPQGGGGGGKSLSSTEAQVRNNFIDMFQRAARWTGGGCVSLGCGLCSTGIVITLLSAVTAFTQGTNIITTLTLGTILLVAFGVVSGVFVGGGAGILLGAQLTDYLRPDLREVSPTAAAQPSDGDAAADVLGIRAPARATPRSHPVANASSQLAGTPNPGGVAY